MSDVESPDVNVLVDRHRQVIDLQMNLMHSVKRYREAKGQTLLAAEAQGLIDELQGRRAVIAELAASS